MTERRKLQLSRYLCLLSMSRLRKGIRVEDGKDDVDWDGMTMTFCSRYTVGAAVSAVGLKRGDDVFEFGNCIPRDHLRGRGEGKEEME